MPFYKGKKKIQLSAKCALNQYVISVWYEFVRIVRMRISEVCDDCFRKLIKNLFLVRVI